MKENKFMDYDAKLSLAQMTIKNIKSIGVDVAQFELRLNKIEQRVNKSVDELKNSSDIAIDEKNSRIDVVYTNALAEIKGFSEELNEYLLYFQIINKCLYVFNSQDFIDYKLSDIIDEIIDAMNSIKKLNTIDDKEVINSLYEVVYCAIKAECRNVGKSKLLEYCKQDENDSVFLTRCIYKDLEELEKSGFDMEAINKQKYRLNYSNPETMYLDEKFVWLISISGDKESYIRDLTNSIKKLLDELKENNNKIYDLAAEKRDLKTKIEDKDEVISRKKKSNINSVVRSLTPLLISVATISTLLGTSTALFNKDTYMTTTEFYSSADGATPDSKKYEKRLLNNNMESTPELTTLTVYEPWVKSEDDGDYERIARIAEIPSEDFEKLSKLDSIDIENTDYKFTESPMFYNGEPTDKEAYFTLERTKQDISDTRKVISSGNGDYLTALFGAYLISLEIYFGLMVTINMDHRTFGIILSIKKFLRDIRYLSDTKADEAKLYELLESAKEIDQKINDVFGKSVLVNDKYNELINKPGNMELLDAYQIDETLMDNYKSEREKFKDLSLRYGKK